MKYQNCTEHTLDVINAAIYQTNDRNQLKANARQYFRAKEVDIDPLKLMMGAIFMPDIAVDDHDEEIQTSTFTTIASYLNESALIEEQFVITVN